MFTGASNMAEGVDRTFIFIFSVAFVFILVITVFMIYSVIRFSRKKGIPARQFSGNAKLEAAWIIGPTIIVLVMFWFGWSGSSLMRNVPKDAMKVTAIGRMWAWEFDYEGGLKSKELVLPVNKPVRVNLKSVDVNHSLFIPAFRVKQDVIPGYNNFLWFIPTKVGKFEILCTEYCGLLHSSMLSSAIVMEQADYDAWYADFKNKAPKTESDGYLLLRNTGCFACHSIDGSKLVGPTFKNLYGSERTVMAGNIQKTVVANDEYIKNSIFDPASEVVAGFGKGIMKSYSNVLKESDIQIIIDYIKSLGGEK